MHGGTPNPCLIANISSQLSASQQLQSKGYGANEAVIAGSMVCSCTRSCTRHSFNSRSQVYRTLSFGSARGKVRLGDAADRQRPLVTLLGHGVVSGPLCRMCRCCCSSSCSWQKLLAAGPNTTQLAAETLQQLRAGQGAEFRC